MILERNKDRVGGGSVFFRFPPFAVFAALCLEATEKGEAEMEGSVDS